ncbi:hypothetical protein [Suttonella ornithocola]|uniref:YjeF C-terminal domain-containing protein n=1 Tax=Suttonella ornithocola TaxID=279832 RepID=A0A380MUX8_9GAMM|nr:Uncharacterised protein [Suttonella ornithocola]
MSGAVILAASAALLAGCGKSYALFAQSSLPMPIIPQYPEIMLNLAENWKNINAIAISAAA